MPASSLAEIVARTLTVWGGLRMRPYSMGDAGPRNDCSSFAAEVLGLPSPLSWSTVNLPGALVLIDFGAAEPGDVWGRMGPGTGGAAGHVAIITGTPRTRSDGRWEVVQQSGPTGVYGPTRNTYANPPAGYRAYRSKYVTGGTMALGDRMLSIGMAGSDVSELQALLNMVQSPALAVDGDFGPLTDAAVRRYQGAAGLEVDGIVGPLTLAALRFSTTPQPPPAPAPQPAPEPVPTPPPAVDLTQLRQVVREELAAVPAAVVAALRAELND